jgi:hypothetical protein
MLGIRDMSQAFMFADGVKPHFQHVIRQEIKMKPKSPKLAANPPRCNADGSPLTRCTPIASFRPCLAHAVQQVHVQGNVQASCCHQMSQALSPIVALAVISHHFL